ncbi:thioredoxin family protein [Corynebacterium alimapuense]|uniref:Thiol reductase thioredoxin n=1 Tax=Corynebacterium alimapuense TaxID=1576874 RepID=A0A3M8K7B0_9CORY|nr:thioredoxin family protein [Corynebacterium alimapuense]RNE49107.1 thiol reductase thioredoxin [Corynebacterium alimapuense]
MITHLTYDTFEEYTSQEGLVFVNFWSTSCGPCLRFHRIYAAAAEKITSAVFGDAEIEIQQRLVKELQISTIPVLLVYRDGELIYRDPSPDTASSTFSTFEGAPRFLDIMYREKDFQAFAEKLLAQ